MVRHYDEYGGGSTLHYTTGHVNSRVNHLIIIIIVIIIIIFRNLGPSNPPFPLHGFASCGCGRGGRWWWAALKQLLEVIVNHLATLDCDMVQVEEPLVDPQNLLDLVHVRRIVAQHLQTLVADHLALLQKLAERRLRVSRLVLKVLAEFAFAL